MQKLFPANNFSFKNLIPLTFFHSKTLSRKHFFIQKLYPANIFSHKNLIPQILLHAKTLSRKYIFMQKPYPANTFSFKNIIPHTLFFSKTLSDKLFFFENLIPQTLFYSKPLLEVNEVNAFNEVNESWSTYHQPEISPRSFWLHFGVTLGSFCDHLGFILG